MRAPRLTRALESFVEAVRTVPPGRVDRVVLFGSRARGDERGDSDVDLLVLVDGRNPALLDTSTRQRSTRSCASTSFFPSG